ncbi:MAG: lipolytic protein family [Polyangiaceae bacterium]|nr:lipolytic protein family [Polyangiaceae bacterium]
MRAPRGREPCRSSTIVVLACFALGLACKERGGTSNVDSRRATQLIVVLGSSTAAGVGPSDPDRAWVPLYARYLAEQFPDFRVQSLAAGGQTTYHILPTGFTPPPGRPAPAVGHNVTAALALAPRALVVNMPSNDAAERYSPAEQLANFDRVRAAADAAHVPLWVTTTQPRNFGDAAQLAAQVEVRDAILRRFAPRTVDFWTTFATPPGKLASRFDAGDGTHLNATGHALLLERVVAAGIPQALSASP